MPGSTPIACTLDAAERPQRERDIRDLGSEALLSVDRDARSATLRFRPEPGIRERVEAIARAEARCCAFLDFDVAETPEAVRLTIVAPAGGEPMMNELASMFAADAEASA
jgi:hypothetical protein